MARSDDLKRFREASFITYLENNGISFDSEIFIPMISSSIL
jgi:hypothetical protein